MKDSTKIKKEIIKLLSDPKVKLETLEINNEETARMSDYGVVIHELTGYSTIIIKYFKPIKNSRD